MKIPIRRMVKIPIKMVRGKYDSGVVLFLDKFYLVDEELLWELTKAYFC